MKDTFESKLGARLRSELNDLKRTPEAFARDAGLSTAEVYRAITGEVDKATIQRCIQIAGEVYPIDVSDMHIVEDDCQHGVRICRAEASAQTSRVFNRTDRQGVLTPYYEYRDTAMSKLAYFRPEWIRQLRYVTDNDPHNPDVIYNNGHLLHQATFFIGPVNFYYEIDGVKYCEQMNTGDSMYISPYLRHTFTTRSDTQMALIIAITFGGHVRRAQKELYQLGASRLKQYQLPIYKQKACFIALLDQHLQNRRMTRAHLIQRLGYDASQAQALFDANASMPTDAALKGIAEVLTMPVTCLLVPEAQAEHEVVITHRDPAFAYAYPSEAAAQYRVSPLARTPRLPNLQFFDIKVSDHDADASFTNTLHNYVFHYGDQPVQLTWRDGEISQQQIIYPGDSVYIQPGIAHAFLAQTGRTTQLVVASIEGAIDLETQKQLSYMASIDRVAGESKQWF